MRTKHLLFVATLAGMAGVMWSFQNQKAGQKSAQPAARAAAPPSTYTPGLAPSSFAGYLTISGLPTIVNQQGPPAANWKVFYNLGDGRYWKGLKNQFDNIQFANKYRLPGTYNAYAETTAIYDDDNNPSLTASLNITPSTPDPLNKDFLVTMNNKAVKLDCSRDPKPGDVITYVITYEHNAPCTDYMRGDIIFHYDAGVLTYTGPDNGHYLGTDQVASSSSMNGEVEIAFMNLAQNTQRNVFLHFTVNSVSLPHTFNAPWVTLEGKISGCPVIQDTANLASQVLVAEHDPNHKEPSLSYISQTGSEIEYTVHFQNDGNGSAQTVIIDDELGLYLSGNITHTGSSHPDKLSSSSPAQISSNPKTWRWVFNNMNLRGTHETGYGTAFSEAETKGYVKFKVTVDTLVPCNAIVNRARIVFGCKPAINTDFAVTRINCTVSPAAPPAPDSILSPMISTLNFCPDTGFHYLTGKTGLTPGASVSTLLSTADLNTIGTDWDSYQWYPTRGLSNAWILNPSLDIARTDTFALIVSKQCVRKLFIVPITTTAPPYTSPILVEDVPGDCWAHLIVSGGTPPYFFQWGYNGSIGSETTADLNLAGKSNISVTVTDSSPGTCTAVFSPVKGKCGCIFDDWGWLEWGVVALAVFGLIYFFIRRKR